MYEGSEKGGGETKGTGTTAQRRLEWKRQLIVSDALCF